MHADSWRHRVDHRPSDREILAAAAQLPDHRRRERGDENGDRAPRAQHIRVEGWVERACVQTCASDAHHFAWHVSWSVSSWRVEKTRHSSTHSTKSTNPWPFGPTKTRLPFTAFSLPTPNCCKSSWEEMMRTML